MESCHETPRGERKTPGAELVSCFYFTSEKNPKSISKLHKTKYLQFVVLACAELLEDLSQSRGDSIWQKTQRVFFSPLFNTKVIQS